MKEIIWMSYEEWVVRQEWEREVYARWGLPYIGIYRKGDSSEKAVAEYRSSPISEGEDSNQNESI